MTVSGGTATTSTSFVVVDALPSGATGRLRLLNLDVESAVEIGIDVIRQGRRTPLDLERTEVDPAGRLIVDLADVGTGSSAVVVTASGPLVAEMVSRWPTPPDHATRSPIPTAEGLGPVPGIGG